MKEEGLIVRSTTKKKYNSYKGEISPDAALVNKMFYSRDWGDTSVQQFIEILDEYLIWYNDKRIKESLGYMSPREYRQSLGLVA